MQLSEQSVVSTVPWSGWADRAARAAFFLVLVLMPFRAHFTLLKRPTLPVYGDYTDFQLYASDIAVLFVLLFWSLSLLAGRRRVRLGSPYVWLPLAGLTVAALLSVLAGIDRVLSLYQSARLGLLFLFYLYICNEMRSPDSILIPTALQVAVQAPVAIAQFLAQRSIGLHRLGELALDPGQNGASIVWSESGRMLRAYGLSDHPNILGGSLAFGLLLLLVAFLHGGEKIRWPAALVFTPGAVALLLTFSRSAWLAFLASALLLALLEVLSRRSARLLEMGGLALASALLLLPFIWANLPLLGVRLGAGQSFSSVPAEQQSLGEREMLARIFSSIFSEHALTGVGLGASPLALRQEVPDLSTNYQPPPLTLLAAAVETGIVGSTFYFLLGFLPWIGFLGRRRVLAADPVLLVAPILLLAVTVVGFFDYYTWSFVPGRLWQWLAWGLASVAFGSKDA